MTGPRWGFAQKNKIIIFTNNTKITTIQKFNNDEPNK